MKPSAVFSLEPDKGHSMMQIYALRDRSRSKVRATDAFGCG
jgi:hypothetical protein